MDFNLFFHVFEIVAIVWLISREAAFSDFAKMQNRLSDSVGNSFDSIIKTLKSHETTNKVQREYMEKINGVLESQCEVNKTQDGINKVTVKLFKSYDPGGVG